MDAVAAPPDRGKPASSLTHTPRPPRRRKLGRNTHARVLKASPKCGYAVPCPAGLFKLPTQFAKPRTSDATGRRTGCLDQAGRREEPTTGLEPGTPSLQSDG